LGATLQYAHVVICHAGVCAFANAAVPIELVNSAMIIIANVLVFAFWLFVCIFSLSP
jgi:hypothetical protein